MIPVSLRTASGEFNYQKEKTSGGLIPLQDEPAIHTFTHWVLKENRFPYDMAYGKHHLLMPLREVSERDQLHVHEKEELEHIIRYFIYPNYDLWFENSPSRRSVPTWYHLHLASYWEDRNKMAL